MRIGWYIHHHGRGHLVRMLAIAAHLDAEIVCFSSLPAPEELPPWCSWVLLERDDEIDPDTGDPGDGDPTVGGWLHWAPLGHRGHRSRMGTIADTLASQPVHVFVVDVSVEVTLLVRLLGVPPVVIAQPGDRRDHAHQLAYRMADTIVAPWPAELMQPHMLGPFRDKTVYTGGVSRFDGRARHAVAPGRYDVVLLGGRGGEEVARHDIDEAITASGRSWHVLGAPSAGWTSDPWEALTAASVVVSWAGQNAVADLGAADAHAVVIPQHRPFGEQHATAEALQRAQLAVVLPHWPSAAEWTDLLARAARLEPNWADWRVAGAAERAADAITSAVRRPR